MRVQSDYGGFASIVQEARTLNAAADARERWNCPRCGFALVQNLDGAVDCPMGHYTRAAIETGYRNG